MATSKGDMLTVPSSCHSARQSQRAGTAADACTMSSQDCRHSSWCLRHAFLGLLCFTHIPSFTVSFPLLCDRLDLFLFHLWGKKLLICLLHIYNNIESYELSRVLLGAVIRIWYSVAIYFKLNSIGLRECQMYSNMCERMHVHVSLPWRSEDSCRSSLLSPYGSRDQTQVSDLVTSAFPC